MNDQAAFWDERYKGEDFAFGTAPNEFLVSQVHHLNPRLRVLVPGDGEGRNGVWLAEQGLIVDTVDVSPLGVAKARNLAKERGVEINATLADLLTWAWPHELMISSPRSTSISSTATGHECTGPCWKR